MPTQTIINTPSAKEQNDKKHRLKNNVDRITKVGDIGIYQFENGIVKEVNYFTSREEKTKTLPI